MYVVVAVVDGLVDRGVLGVLVVLPLVVLFVLILLSFIVLLCVFLIAFLLLWLAAVDLVIIAAFVVDVFNVMATTSAIIHRNCNLQNLLLLFLITRLVIIVCPCH